MAAEMKNSLKRMKSKKLLRMQGKTSEMENMREKIKKLEYSSYRFIFIISILRKRKHRNGQTKIIQDFPRIERTCFQMGSVFLGTHTQHSGFTTRHIFMRFQNSQERENILPASREENKTESEHLLCKESGVRMGLGSLKTLSQYFSISQGRQCQLRVSYPAKFYQ